MLFLLREDHFEAAASDRRLLEPSSRWAFIFSRYWFIVCVVLRFEGSPSCVPSALLFAVVHPQPHGMACATGPMNLAAGSHSASSSVCVGRARFIHSARRLALKFFPFGFTPIGTASGRQASPQQ